MSPDTALGQLAQRVSRLEQRVEDMIVRVSERLAEITAEIRRDRDDAEHDVRSFAPTVKTVHEIEIETRHANRAIETLSGDLRSAITEFRHGLGELEDRFDSAEREREKFRREREEKERERERADAKDREDRAATERRDRWARWSIAASLFLLFLAMLVNLLSNGGVL